MKEVFFVILIFLCSCVDVSYEESSGGINEILFVLDKEHNKKSIKDFINSKNQNFKGLPQKQKTLDITYIPSQSFKDIFKKQRCIAILAESETESFRVINEKWAGGQKVFYFTAPDSEKIKNLLYENIDTVFHKTQATHIDFLFQEIKSQHNKDVYNYIKDKFNISFYAPGTFVLNKEGKNTVWFLSESEKSEVKSVVENWIDKDIFLKTILVDRRIANDDGFMHFYHEGGNTYENHNYFYQRTTYDYSQGSQGSINPLGRNNGTGRGELGEAIFRQASGMSRIRYVDTLINYTTIDFNTGWMVGDIKGAFLSSTDDTNLSGTSLIANGDFSSSSTAAFTTVAGGTAAVVGGLLKLTDTGGAFCYASAPFTTVIGNQYYVTVDIVNNSNTATSNQ